MVLARTMIFIMTIFYCPTALKSQFGDLHKFRREHPEKLANYLSEGQIFRTNVVDKIVIYILCAI
jgi:hypothetical protein